MKEFPQKVIILLQREKDRQKQEEIDSALELNFLYRKTCHK